MKTFLCALLMLMAGAVAAAPKAELWARWQIYDRINTDRIDHAEWDLLLQKYVRASADGINRVGYAQIDAEDRHRLADYLEHMQRTRISLYNRAEQRAYWINLYNATTLSLVLDHYPLESIFKLDISPGWFAHGPWGKKLLKIENQEVSLDDIEHGILRPIWNDPRTHYSVNCASLGCPNLAPRAWSAASMEAMLEAGARAYVNHPRGARVENGRLQVSSIYEWFKSDFGGDDAGVIAHLRKYAEAPLAAQLEGIGKISGNAYDWTLNGVK